MGSNIADTATGGATPGRFLKTFALVLAAGLLALAALNYLVNPYGYYPTRLVPALVWSSRVTKVELMRARPAPDVLIIGSSRAMSLAPAELERLAGASGFNASVDSAHAEDFYAILRFAVDELGWRPREVWIGVDLEAFHNHLPPDDRLLASPELARFLPWTMRARGIARRAAALVSGRQAESSLQALWMKLYAGFPKPQYTFAADGVIQYQQWERELAAGTFQLVDGRDQLRARFDGFTGLDPARVAFFDALVGLATSHGIALRVFITPLSDVGRRVLLDERGLERLDRAALGYFTGFVGRVPGFRFRDYSDVRAFGGDPTLFWDDIHMRDENARRLLRALVAD